MQTCSTHTAQGGGNVSDTEQTRNPKLAPGTSPRARQVPPRARPDGTSISAGKEACQVERKGRSAARSASQKRVLGFPRGPSTVARRLLQGFEPPAARRVSVKAASWKAREGKARQRAPIFLGNLVVRVAPKLLLRNVVAFVS